jgi:ATP-dependent Clp protease ATP-binding subunit ClpA
MFERYTDRARRVVVLAQEEARLLDHHYIGTEHILLGLVGEGEGIAARVLESFKITSESAVQAVLDLVGKGSQSPVGHIPFTPRAKKSLELSLREALLLGHNYIGTEHVLLGLIREGEGMGAQVLAKLGAEHSLVRTRVIEAISHNNPIPGSADAPKPRAKWPMSKDAQDAIRRIQLAAKTVDNEYISRGLELEIVAFEAGWNHEVPESWLTMLDEADPEYKEYLRLKAIYEPEDKNDL